MEGVIRAYKALPPVTRFYVTSCIGTTLAVQFSVLTPFHLYLNWHAIRDGQVWRLYTTFTYFGDLSINFIFHMFFLVRYCKMLEDGSFRGRSADFFWMLFIGSVLLLSMTFVMEDILFLGPALSFMMVYVWGRRNPNVLMSFLGVFNFTGPYLPFVLLGFGLMVGQGFKIDIMGIVAGHVYYYLEDFYPALSNRRILKTPRFIKYIIEGNSEELEYEYNPGTTSENYENVDEGAGAEAVHLPGGYDWGGQTNNQLRPDPTTETANDNDSAIPTTTTTTTTDDEHINELAQEEEATTNHESNEIKQGSIEGEGDRFEFENTATPTVSESKQDDNEDGGGSLSAANRPVPNRNYSMFMRQRNVGGSSSKKDEGEQ